MSYESYLFSSENTSPNINQIILSTITKSGLTPGSIWALGGIRVLGSTDGGIGGLEDSGVV